MGANIEVKGKSSIRTLYMKYVSQNICGMLGISLYVFADTLFISIAEGAVGITALNLVLPVYSLIYALGAMIGVGSAIRFRILRAQGDEKAEKYFFQAFFWVYLLGAVFMLIGALFPEKLVSLLGGNGEIIAVGTPYTRIFMMFGPCFMLNHVFNAFVRNDGNPSLAMIATVSSSLFNIVMDYVFMFPMKMGMAGAALATGC
ncbi:MATE family efflux transporter, partial [Clostridium fessum]|uniref:MATE family efflux transporter n=1 Tax=Clostridium fessum TaxID=2126740 RepID=UPI00399ADD72